MPSSSSVLVLHCPAGGGHRAAALAIAEAARARGLEARVLDALASTPPWFAQAYVGTHLGSTAHAPAVYGRLYAAMNHRSALRDGVRGTFDRLLGKELLREVLAARPAAVVATHFFPLAVLGAARLAGRLRAPLVGVVTDYAAHAFWAERGVDRFCTAAGQAPRDLVRHGVSPSRVVATGIPVRAAFGALPRVRAPAPGEPLRVLVTSGGFGIGPTAEVLRSFAGLPGLALTVVCGAGEARVAEARKAAAEAGVTTTVVGYERDMPARMAEAHVVVGKPGGLTVSEALAAGRPMVLVGACPGQEAQNQAWLLENDAALAAAPGEVGAVVGSLRAGGRLEALARAASSLAAPHAACRVLDVALRRAEVRLPWLIEGRDRRDGRDEPAPLSSAA